MTKLIICVDGLGYDMISKECTPFLYSKEVSRLKTLFAFTGLEYAFFSGKNPSESKIWLEFCKDSNSLFRSKILKYTPFRNYYGAFLQLMNNRGWLSSLHNIPRSRLKYFDTSVKSGIWSCDYFKNKKHVVYKWPFFVVDGKKKLILKYEKDYGRLKRLFDIKGKDVYYTQLMRVDKVVHKFGKNSIEAKRSLKKMDALLEKIYDKFDEVIIWSDHGFADINEYIDIERKLPKRGDYIYFIAGTTISFWFANEEAKKEVLEVLSEIEGKILDEELAKKYEIPLDRKYGDIVFFVKKGKYFFPNYYQKTMDERFAAMHGYPDNNELDGFFLSKKKVRPILKINEARRYL